MHVCIRLGSDETFFVEDVGYCSITFIWCYVEYRLNIRVSI